MKGVYYAYADLLCITENAKHPIHFPDIRLQIYMWCLVGCNSVIICCNAQVKMIKH